MRDLINAHPVVVAQHLHQLADSVVDMIIGPFSIDHASLIIPDEEKTVRTALVTFVSTLLAHLTPSLAAPLLSLFVVYVSHHRATFFFLTVVKISHAMTHFDRDIRLDALLVLNVWLERFPQLLRHKSRDLLANYFSLLGQPAAAAGASVRANSNVLFSSLK